jgi:lysophospholipase L1-like esterase
MTRWVGTWTTSPVITEGLAFENQTLRIIGRISLGGRKFRVRLSNAYGKQKLTIGAARLALREAGAAIVKVSDRKLTFAGKDSVSIPAGALMVSDPVDLDLPALADVAVSVFLPGAVPESFQITGHGNAHQTNYVSTAGNHCDTVAMPVQATTESWYFVTSIDVEAADDTAGLVCFGDSLTDANLSSLDTNHRWPDQLARRLAARSGGRPIGIMNQGIGGNRILHDVRGDCGLKRFDRDVLAQPGVTHCIVFLGINDIRYRADREHEIVTAEEMCAGYAQFATRARARGLKIYGATLLTFEDETFLAGAYTKAGEEKRRAVNAWIRSSGTFDAVLDFEAALRDPANPTQMLPIYDCGDHLHPSDRGYDRLGDSIDLKLLD